MLDLSQSKYVTLKERMEHTIETGFADYDRHVFDLKPGEITVLFGRNGEGKSTVASQILAHHINSNKRAYLYSGELSENKVQEWLYRQVVGSDAKFYDMVETKYGPRTEIKPEVVEAVKKWHDKRLFMYNMKTDKIRKDTSWLFKDMAAAALVGTDLFVIDNLMTAFLADERSQFADQANFVQDCKNFAVSHNCHVIIVAHPNKDKGELTHESRSGNLTKNDVSGSGNIGNKADNIIAVERVWKVGEVRGDKRIPDAFITSLKDREEGVRAIFHYWLSQKSLRFHNASTPKHVVYGWENYIDTLAMAPPEDEDDCPF